MTDASYTHLCLVVDRSGSMSDIARDMDGAIKSLLAEQAAQPGAVLVDIITFDTKVEHPYTDARPDDVKGDLIVPRGATALNDALGNAIVSLGEKLARMKEEDRPGTVIIAVVTDGQENSSVEYGGSTGAERIKEMVRLQQEQYGWQFLFLGTGIDSFSVAGAYGFARGATMNFARGEARTMAGSTSAYISAVRSGATDYEFTEEDRKAAMGE